MSATDGTEPRRSTLQQRDALLVLVFFGVGLLGVSQHEMWRDELRGWLIARDRAGDLLGFLAYEGHPPLWYVAIIPLVHLGLPVGSLGVMNVVAGTAAIALVAAYAPFTRAQKVLLALGYYPLCEYLLVSRSYIFVELFFFAFCATWVARPRRYLGAALALFALSLTHAFGALLSLAIAAHIALDAWLDQRANTPLRGASQALPRIPLLVAAGVVAVACTSLWLCIPPADALPYARRIQASTVDRYVLKQVADLSRAYLPFEKPAVLWSVMLDSDPGLLAGLFFHRVIQVLALPLCLGTALWLLWPRWRVILLYLTGTLGLWSVLFVKHLEDPRHVGVLYLFLLTCLWLVPPLDPRRARALSVLLALHAVAGIAGYLWDLRYSYSGSRAMAEYLREQKLDRRTIVSGETRVVETLSAVLGRPIHHAGEGQPGTLYALDQKRNIGNREALRAASEMAMAEGRDVILVSGKELRRSVLRSYRLREPAVFRRDWSENGETYYVYEVAPYVPAVMPEDRKPGGY